MSFKSSRGRDLGKELAIMMSSKLGQSLGSGSASSPSGLTATGGATFQDDTYTYHAFVSADTFSIVSGSATCRLIIIGGGGGGSGYAPGYYHGTGGVDSYINSIPPSFANNELRAAGGGAGGGYNPSDNVTAGGSGGGGGAGVTGGAANTYNPLSPRHPGTVLSSAFGHGGGAGGATYDGGGGGGAGGAGSDAPPTDSGPGGPGKSVFGGSASVPSSYGAAHPSSPGRWFCGGGGGSGGDAGNEGVGGVGGGGNGRGPQNTDVPGSKGQVNTGSGGGAFNNAGGGGSGGGGAGSFVDEEVSLGPGPYGVVIGAGGNGAPDTHPTPGGAGGSGFVIIRYTT